jgi:hypothetical protein
MALVVERESKQSRGWRRATETTSTTPALVAVDYQLEKPGGRLI